MTLSWSKTVRRTPLLALLGGFSLLHILALALFARGFLLTRVELTTRSTCSDAADALNSLHTIQETSLNDSSGSLSQSAADGAARSGRPKSAHAGGPVADEARAGCWGARHFNKSAWIIIDALRFDFVAGCDGRPGAGDACRSRMPRLLQLVESAVSCLLAVLWACNVFHWSCTSCILPRLSSRKLERLLYTRLRRCFCSCPGSSSAAIQICGGSADHHHAAPARHPYSRRSLHRLRADANMIQANEFG